MARTATVPSAPHVTWICSCGWRSEPVPESQSDRGYTDRHAHMTQEN